MAKKVVNEVEIKTNIDDVNKELEKVNKRLELFGRQYNKAFGEEKKQLEETIRLVKIKQKQLEDSLKKQQEGNKQIQEQQKKNAEEEIKLDNKVTETQIKNDKKVADFNNDQAKEARRQLENLRSTLSEMQSSSTIGSKYYSELEKQQSKYKMFSALFGRGNIIQNLGAFGEELIKGDGTSSKEITSLRNQLENLEKQKKYAQRLRDAGDIEGGEAELTRIAGEKSLIQGKFDKASSASLKTSAALTKLHIAVLVVQKTFEVLNSFTSLLGVNFKDLAHGVKDTITQMTDLRSGIATYSADTLVTNRQARETRLRYGFDTATTYGFTRASALLNVQSDEDLMYMSSGQRELFISYMEKFSQFYSKMEESGVLQNIQKMQLDLEMFKQEVAMSFLEWVSKNKETILGIMKAIGVGVVILSNAVVAIYNLLMDLFNFGRGRMDYISMPSFGSDSVNNSNNRSQTNIINVNASTNATGVLGSQQALSEFNKEFYNNLGKQIAVTIPSL